MVNKKQEDFSQRQIPQGGSQQESNNNQQLTREERGRIEVTKDRMRDEARSKRRFSALLKRSEKELLKISSFFPFDLFPDEITIYEDRVNIVFRDFFFSRQIVTAAIKEIKDVVAEVSILFATLKITIDGYDYNPATVKYLKRSEAIRARRIIEGLTIVAKEEIDLSKIERKDMAKALEDLGKAGEIEYTL